MSHSVRSFASRGNLFPGLIAVFCLLFGGESVLPAAPPVVAPRPAPPVVFVPYDKLEDAIASQGGSGSIVVPLKEYRRLRALERQAAIPPDRPAAVISASRYTATVEESLVRIQAELTVRVLGEEWSEVPIQFGSAAIGQVTAEDGQQVLLRAVGPGSYRLVLDQPGEHVLTLDLTSRVELSPDGRFFEMTIPSVGVTTLDLTLPKPDQTVTITPNAIRQPVEDAEGTTRVLANLGATDRLRVLWHDRVGDQPEMNLLAGATNTLRVGFADRVVSTRATIRFDVLRGSLGQVRIAAPKDDRIVSVSSPDVLLENWERTEEENRQVIAIDLLDETTDPFVIEINTERDFPEFDRPFSVLGLAGNLADGIHPLDVVRETGTVVVTHDPELTVTVTEQSGLVRATAEELPAASGANAMGYRFFGSAASLRLSLQPLQPLVRVEQLARYTLLDNRLDLQATVGYEIDRIGVFRLELLWPEGWELDRVTAPNLSGDTLVDGRLVLSFDRRVRGEFAIEILAHRDVTDELADLAPGEEAALTLTPPEPTNVSRETGQILLFVPPRLEGRIVTDDEGDAAGLDRLPAVFAAPARTRLLSAWAYAGRPVKLDVAFSPKPTRIAATVATRVDLGEARLGTVTDVTFEVENAPVGEFVFDLPEAWKDSVLVQEHPDSDIRIAESSPSEATEGRVPWTVRLREPTTGSVAFRVSYRRPSPLATGKPVEWTIDPVRVLGAGTGENLTEPSGLIGELVIAQDRAVASRTTETTGGLEPIDLRERTLATPAANDASEPSANGANNTDTSVAVSDGERLTRAYRYQSDPVSVTIVAEKYEVQTVVETVVSKMLAEIIVGTDDLATYRVRYRLRTSERQRLPLFLPMEMTPLAVLVGDSPATLEENPDAKPPEGLVGYFVNVSRDGNADERFSLTVAFRVPLTDPPFEGSGGQLRFPLPQLGGSGVVTQEQRVAVWVPEDYALVRTPDGFDGENVFGSFGSSLGTSSAGLEEWIGQEASPLIDFPTSGHHMFSYVNLGGAEEITVSWVDQTFYTWVLSGAVFLIGLVLLRTGWTNRIAIVLGVAFLAAMASLADPEPIAYGLRAASWGLVATGILWVVMGVMNFEWPTRPESSPVTIAGGTSAVAAPPGTVIPPPDVFRQFF